MLLLIRTTRHLKKLFCLHCQEEVNHVEVREIGGYTEEDFKLEFNLGRFIDGLRKPLDKLATCTNKNCQYNIDKRCWNANHSYKCGHRPEKGVDNNE